MARWGGAALAIFILGSSISLAGCQGLVIDTERLLKPSAELSEIVGLLAGFGTTFAAFPDLLAMLRRRYSEGRVRRKLYFAEAVEPRRRERRAPEVLESGDALTGSR